MAVNITPEERVRRRRSLRLHIIVALFTLLVLIAANAMLTSAYPWWLWVLVAWMPLVGGHTAWSMGLFDRNNEGS
jgi:hypothetical protein